MKHNIQKQLIGNSLMHRIAMIAMLFIVFAISAKAQEESDIQETGRRNRTVYINDLEDHTWTYYSGVDTSVDGGNYNNNYIGKLYSPNPRNVMITYNGVNDVDGSETDVRVSIDNENENRFVYYKTLEQGDTEGEYTYTVISNPFSVRPSRIGADNKKVYYGFNGWKIISGGEYIKGYNNEAILPLDAEIIFEELPYDEANCISAKIVLQTTWTPLNNIVHRNSTSTSTYSYTTKGGTYETNILVLTSNQNGNITVKSPCTIMMVEPDGSGDYRSSVFSQIITPWVGPEGRTKIEYSHWQPDANINARGRNVTIGRGMKMDGETIRAFYGTNTDTIVVNQDLRIESGKFKNFTHYNTTPIAIEKQRITLGCDYDRAENDNSKLEFTERFIIAASKQLNLDSDDELCRVYSLSGKFMTSITDVGDAKLEHSYYVSITGTTADSLGEERDNRGYRYLEIQGGEWVSIAGGRGESHDKNIPAFSLRIKGGHVKGSIYGAAEYAGANGTRTFVITGGTINGWVAGGANGTRSSGGKLSGASYVYVGGKAKIDSRERIDNKEPNAVINRAVGGNVFGAGCGYSPSSTSGQVTLGTHVVIADSAYVERGVYAGGSFGYCTTTQTSYIYITGGTVGGNVGGVNAIVTSYDSKGNPVYDDKEYNPNIIGGVFGGACQNNGGNVNMYMTGGTVYGGIYGGSNASGTISGNINMNIHGGTVGASDKATNIHGGGYGSATAVNGNVSLTLGKNGAEEGTTVYGDVYGGSALGVVNNAVSNKTEVTFNGGNINGSLYGGGLGDSGNAATVKGNVTVTTNGGIVIGAIYGCNNVNGAPQGTVTVNMNGGDANYVYGGGNLAAYTYNGNYPVVNVRGGTIRYALYGGGLGETAIVTGNPQVLMTGGTVGSTETVDDKKIVHGDIFGGGNAAAVNGSANVTITGGEVKRNVYGGGNQATVSGTTNVVIGKGK